MSDRVWLSSVASALSAIHRFLRNQGTFRMCKVEPPETVLYCSTWGSSGLLAAGGLPGIRTPLAARLIAFHAGLLQILVPVIHRRRGVLPLKEYFGMSVAETLRTWSPMETAILAMGVVLVLALPAL